MRSRKRTNKKRDLTRLFVKYSKSPCRSCESLCPCNHCVSRSLFGRTSSLVDLWSFSYVWGLKVGLDDLIETCLKSQQYKIYMSPFRLLFVVIEKLYSRYIPCKWVWVVSVNEISYYTMEENVDWGFYRIHYD